MIVRKPRNPAERVCVEKLMAQGYTVHRKGWPDLLAERDGSFILVEVREKRSRRHKHLQRRVMQTIVARQIKAYQWDADEGFVPLGVSTDRI
jgi:Holliday junction resolvase-like predicted endonuclease